MEMALRSFLCTREILQRRHTDTHTHVRTEKSFCTTTLSKRYQVLGAPPGRERKPEMEVILQGMFSEDVSEKE